MAMMSPEPPSRWWQQAAVRSGLIVVILLAIALISGPRYLSGTWAWREPAEVANIAPLRALRDQGLVVPDWPTSQQRQISIGSQAWSFQEIRPDRPVAGIQTQKPSYLFLRPQDWHDQEPQVEWVDLNGFWSRVSMGAEPLPAWKMDSRQRLSFQVPSPQGEAITIEAQYLRGLNRQQTFAILQWYTWPTGGTPRPADWFWADQRSRLATGDRAPWVAVSLLLPVPPLADLASPGLEMALVELGQLVQTQLLTEVLLPAQTPIPEPESD